MNTGLIDTKKKTETKLQNESPKHWRNHYWTPNGFAAYDMTACAHFNWPPGVNRGLNRWPTKKVAEEHAEMFCLRPEAIAAPCHWIGAFEEADDQ